jgi:hypothetical protein
MHLGIEELTEFLDRVVFECDLITDAFMGLDYHSGGDTQLFTFQWPGGWRSSDNCESLRRGASWVALKMRG